MWKCSECGLFWKYNWIYDTNELSYDHSPSWGRKICDSCHNIINKRNKLAFRLNKLRQHVQLRSIVIYWLDKSSRRACAPGGPAFKRDIREFNSFMNNCIITKI